MRPGSFQGNAGKNMNHLPHKARDAWCRRQKEKRRFPVSPVALFRAPVWRFLIIAQIYLQLSYISYKIYMFRGNPIRGVGSPRSSADRAPVWRTGRSRVRIPPGAPNPTPGSREGRRKAQPAWRPQGGSGPVDIPTPTHSLFLRRRREMTGTQVSHSTGRMVSLVGTQVSREVAIIGLHVN